MVTRVIKKESSHLSCYVHLWEEIMLPSFNKSLHFENLATLLYLHPVSVESGLEWITFCLTKLNWIYWWMTFFFFFTDLCFYFVLGKNIIAIVIRTKLCLKNTLPTNMFMEDAWLQGSTWTWWMSRHPSSQGLKRLGRLYD